MGQISSKLLRPFRNFNVENRAVKVLERRQKVGESSPVYPSTAEKLSRYREEHPEYLEAQKQRDENLHEHLKKVYVESTGDNTAQPKASTKSLPLNRKALPDTDMGVLEQTSDISEGRIPLKTVFAFMAQHRADPQTNTATSIAEEHKLDLKDVENVLQYFKILRLHIPQEMYQKNKKLTKIVAEQMQESSSHSSFLLPKKTEGKDKLEGDVSHTKT